jgi:hypothetical protein
MQQAAFTEAAPLVIRWCNHLACFLAPWGTGHAGFFSVPIKAILVLSVSYARRTHIIILYNVFPLLRGQVSEDAPSVGGCTLVQPRDPTNWHFTPLLPSGTTLAAIEGPTDLSVATMLDTLASPAFFKSGVVFFCPNMDGPSLLARRLLHSKPSLHFCSTNFSNWEATIP